MEPTLSACTNRLMAMVLAVATAAVMGAAPVRAVDGNFTTYDSRTLLLLDGAWISRGYGHLWHVREGRVTEYDLSGTYCIAIASHDGMPDSAARRVLLDRAKQVMRIGVADGIGYLHTFDRRPALPAPCLAKPDSSPAGVFEAVDQIFRTHYAFFARRRIDWPKVVAAYRPRLNERMSDAELFALLSDLLEHTGDEHVTLRGWVDGERRSFSARGKPIGTPPQSTTGTSIPGRWSPAAALALLGPSARRNSTGSIVYGLIDAKAGGTGAGSVGYLNLRSLWWRRLPDLDDTLDDAVAMFQAASIVIVDVSSNGGGGEDLGKRVAERFAAARTIGLYKYAGDGEGEKPQPIYVVPSRKTRFLGPAYVITSRETFSAAETLAMYMSVLPNVVHLGRPTAGALSDVLSRRLPNGWRVGLSNEIYLDAASRSWEGIGIPPTVALAVEPDQRTASARDIEAARVVLEVLLAKAQKRSGARD